jgi:riboflavin kinase/FMN adenylyltransferase
MKLLRLHAHTPHHQIPATVVTIGNFDGIHLGHQAMIQQLKQVAQAEQLKSLVLIFEPQPLEFFVGYEAPPRISSLREKVELLAALGVDYVAVARFDQAFRSMSAEEFAGLLKRQLNARSLILGDDFHFGKNRSGDSDFLRRAGFAVVNLDTVCIAEQRVSSTRIRQVLQQGDLAQVAQLLGRPYSITGHVLHGDKIGRSLDFPTINVALHRHKPCLHGIYAVEVECLQLALADQVKQADPARTGIGGYSPQSLIGAANVGTRPAIQQDHPQWRLEVHFPDVSANLYGLLMRVKFLHYLHGEQHYASLQALKQGIAEDVQQIRRYRQQQVKDPFSSP